METRRTAMETQPVQYQVESVTLHEQPVLVVRGSVAESRFAPFLGEAFGHVGGVAAGDGMYVSGPPFARIHPEADGTFTVEAGFPVSGMLLGQGDVKASHLPGGRALRTTHQGGYAEVHRAHEALHAYARDHGLEPGGDAWEVYLDGPEVAQPRTVVVLPVRPGDGADGP
jgi:effector-binding domain-containing protein